MSKYGPLKELSKRILATNSKFIIPIFLQPEDKAFYIYSLRLFDPTKFIVWKNKSGWKDLGIRKLELMGSVH